MDYEKKYKEALERARKLHSETEYVCEMEMLEQIFHELKENETEKIREEIVDYLKKFIPHHDYDLVTKSKQWIAWLEKQSTPQIRTGLEWYNTIDDACDKRYSEEYAHGEYCHEQSFKWGFQEGVEWLENQSEREK